MSIAIYTLTSELHDEQAVNRSTQEFLGSLNLPHTLCGTNYSDYGTHDLSLLYVRTGGTEGVFLKLLPLLRQKSSRPFRLLTSGKSNSLAASMEILSYLKQQGLEGSILHGSPDHIRSEALMLEQVETARRKLHGKRLGIIGKPSDWLISSHTNHDIVREKLGIELVDIPMQEVKDALQGIDSALPQHTLQTETEALSQQIAPIAEADREQIQASLPGALKMYHALKQVVQQHRLDGFTIRCFDLLTAVHNTGCTALAKLNAEEIVAGCEGDVPTMLSMAIAQAVTGVTGFQANPSSIDPDSGEMLFAHCTIPLNIVERFELDTHFESGIGVGIRGYMPLSDVTVFKVAPDLSSYFAAEGRLLRNEAKPDLCRTQQIIQLNEKDDANYFLNDPIGNHHVIVPGRWEEAFETLMDDICR